MSGDSFDGGWLALREPVDHRSRADSLVEDLAFWRGRDPSRVVDLGCGTGSNLRYLAPRLWCTQRWVMVDADPAHLASEALKEADHFPGVLEIQRVQGDLAREGIESVAGAHIVTASALLDLVSEEWIQELARACARAHSAVLIALSWDGTVSWRETERRPASESEFEGATDALVLAAVHAHQHRDKGLGAALGPDAPRVAEQAFRSVGYNTRLAPSPWRLNSADSRLAFALIDGWASAASEQEPEHGARIAGWADRRKSDLAAGLVTLEVGHMDLLALPATQ